MISFEIEGMLKVVSEVDKLHDDDLGIHYGLLNKHSFYLQGGTKYSI